MSYEKQFNRGDISDAVDYGHKVWGRELPRLLGIYFLGSCLFSLLTGQIDVDNPFTTKGILLGLVEILVLAFLLGTSARILLDCIRERRAELFRGIVAGFQNILPMTLVALMLVFTLTAASFIGYLWMLPVSWLETKESGFSDGLTGILITGLVLSLLFLLIFPVYIWLMAWIPFASSRVLDRKSKPWTASVWAMGKLIPRFSRIMKIGYGQIWAQFIGMAVCLIGLVAVYPLTGLSFTALYEWVRLRGPDPDEY